MSSDIGQERDYHIDPQLVLGALEIAGIDEDEVVQLMITPNDSLLDIYFIRQGEVDEELLLTTSTTRLFTDYRELRMNLYMFVHLRLMLLIAIAASAGEVPIPFGMVVSLAPDLNNIGMLAKNTSH